MRVDLISIPTRTKQYAMPKVNTVLGWQRWSCGQSLLCFQQRSLGFWAFSAMFFFSFLPQSDSSHLFSALDHLCFSAVLWSLKCCENICTFGPWVCECRGLAITDGLEEREPATVVRRNASCIKNSKSSQQNWCHWCQPYGHWDPDWVDTDQNIPDNSPLDQLNTLTKCVHSTFF